MIIWQSFIIILIIFHLAFFAGMILRNDAVVDPFWGIGFVVVAWYTLFKAEIISLHHFTITILVTIWGTRLTYHLLKRLSEHKRDWRYEEMRSSWKKWTALHSYFKVYLLQATLMFIISLPIIYLNSNEINMAGFYLLSLGLIVWSIGFFFESVSDKELRAFKSNPKNKGKIMDHGLWRYSRHPNYFGEATMWWGVWIISLSSQPFSAWLILSPITITYLLVNVSGMPLLEKKLIKNLEYKKYASRTSPFIPKRPK